MNICILCVDFVKLIKIEVEIQYILRYQTSLSLHQSTDEDKYEDHINCVSGPEELAKQAELINVVYSGTKILANGMNRFMVIGK